MASLSSCAKLALLMKRRERIANSSILRPSSAATVQEWLTFIISQESLSHGVNHMSTSI